MSTRRGGLRLLLPCLALLGSAGCQRQAAPVYVPPPASPSGELPAMPAPASGEQLTIARACAGDIERFCAGVPPRQGDIKACMKAHVTELSAGCFDTVMGAIAAEQAP